jgi:hypothetical protein
MNFDTIKEMFKLQDSFNEYTVPGWKHANLAWHRAIWLECAEAVDSLDWKWWKHKEADMDNLKVEMVDIWHFLMSHVIIHSPDVSINPENYEHLFIKKSHSDDMNIIEGIENLASHVLSKTEYEFAIYIFTDIWNAMGYTYDDLYHEYIIKNVLNKFRQDNGYKTGTYIKMWNSPEGKVEDNVMAWYLATDLPTITMFESLYDKLTYYYNKEVTNDNSMAN